MARKGEGFGSVLWVKRFSTHLPRAFAWFIAMYGKTPTIQKMEEVAKANGYKERRYEVYLHATKGWRIGRA